MARLTLNDARTLAARSRPWTFRMEFRGVNAANQSGWSEKFWLATGRGLHEPVEIHYGAIGSTGTILVKDWAYVEQTAPEKEAKGYTYEDTPYVRVRQSTIDAFMQAGGAAAPAPKPATTTPKPIQAPPQVWTHPDGVTVRCGTRVIELTFDKFPKPWTDYHKFKGALAQHTGKRVDWTDTETFEICDNTQATFVAVCNFIQIAAMPPAVPATPPPALPPVNGGLTGPYGRIASVRPEAGAWKALDVAGKVVLTLTAQGARDLVTSYPHITVAGLG